MQNAVNNEKKGFLKNFSNGIKVPHTLVIIFSIIILMAIATYIVPGGSYDRVIADVNGQSKTVVLNGSFHYVENEAYVEEDKILGKVYFKYYKHQFKGL